MRYSVKEEDTVIPASLMEFQTEIVCDCVKGVFVNGLRGGCGSSNRPS